MNQKPYFIYMRRIQELSSTRKIRCMILAEVISELNSVEFDACGVRRLMKAVDCIVYDNFNEVAYNF